MKHDRVIAFEPRERILTKAKQYVDSVETFLEDGDQAVSLLFKAMKLADDTLKHEIMVVLGSFAKEEIAWPLVDLMTDASESEEVRHNAAIQLSVIAPFLKNSQALVDRLVREIESSDAERGYHATYAMGWRGNTQAAISLIERLYDSDPRVQQSAVNALSNLGDNRVLDLLLDRLNNGLTEQKRVILFNLWRFHFDREKVVAEYLKCLRHDNPDLRFDALVCLGTITKVQDHLSVYRNCMSDKDARIRELALKRLVEEGGEIARHSLRPEIETLLDDPDMKIKGAAWKILRKHRD